MRLASKLPDRPPRIGSKDKEQLPARTGDQYIAGLKENQPEVYLSGERVKDITTHPALCNAVRTMAQLYDMQHDPALRDEMTYSSPTTGDPVGLSFITPGTPRPGPPTHHDGSLGPR